MRRKPALILVAVLFVCGLVHGQNDEGAPICKSPADCNQRGTALLKEGKVDDAIRYFEEQASQAEVSDIDREQSSAAHSSTRPTSVLAYNNLAVAYMRKKDYLQARAWTRVALRWDKSNNAALFNMERIEPALRRWKWPNHPAGEYARYAGRGMWQSIIVEPSPAGQLKFCYFGMWAGIGPSPPSGIGELRATLPLNRNTVTYRTHEYGDNECVISLALRPDAINATQKGSEWDCGFGHNVSASGTFERVSTLAKCPPEEER